MADEKKKIHGTIFDLEAIVKVGEAVQSLEKILGEKSVARIKESKALAKHAQIKINELFKIAEKVSDSQTKKIILGLIPRVMIAPIAAEQCFDELANAVFPLAKHGDSFKHGPKHPRGDNLKKAMITAWRACQADQGGIPSAFEVWDWIPVEGDIQEKDPDTKTIYWRRSKNKDAKPTTFKTFQNRYTALKKQLISE